MSRLTGADAYGLMEAYNNVYAPQELTEEQVWEEVENWVNSLLEEGYDLSDYTWEEMYESYINEDLMGDLAANAGNIKRGLSGAYQGAMKTASNVNKSISDRMQSNIKSVKPAPSFQQSAGFGRYGAPETQRGNQDKYKSTSDGKMYKNYNDALAANRSRNKKTDTPTSPAATAAASKPAAAGARPSGGTPASPKVAPKPPKPAMGPTGKPLVGGIERRTPTSAELKGAQAARAGGGALAQATAAASTPAAFNPTPTASTPTPAARPATPPKPTPRQTRLNMEMEYNTFDTVLEHLVSEGYADTEESALAIMTNMSEEWRQSILGEGDNYDKNRRAAAKRAADRNAARDRGQTGNVPGVGYVTPRRERETYIDSAGTERHTSGAKMPKKEG